MRHPFIPLFLELTLDPEDSVTVGNVFEATELLRTRWPKKDGQTYMEALKACIAALEGHGSGEAVRDALIAAARDANVSVDR